MALWFPSMSVLLIGPTALSFRTSTNLKSNDGSDPWALFESVAMALSFLDLNSAKT
jgi:hypothetical protein